MNRKMATYFCKFVAVLGLLACSISSSYAAEPRSYPMLCKGGGNTTVYINSVASPHGLSVKIGFNKATRAATSGLNAGECAWMDRGITANEPATMVVELSDVFYQASMKVNTGGDNLRLSFHGNGRKVGELERLIQNIKQGREYQVYAYNNKRGQFIVTRVGP